MNKNINNITNPIKSSIENILDWLSAQSLYIFISFAIATVAFVTWSLNKGLIFYDEAWYLLHFNQNVNIIHATEWSSYFKFMNSWSLLSIRQFTVGLIVLSMVVFTIGLDIYLNLRRKIHLFLCGVIGLFIVYTPVQLVPNYISFNSIILYLGSGIFLLGLSKKGSNISYLFLSLAGFCFAQLTFVMPTNLPIYMVLLFMLYEKDNWLLPIATFLLASAIGVLFFFLAYTAPSVFLSDFSETLNYLKLDKSHGLYDMFIRSLILCKYLVFSVLPLALLIWLSISNKFQNIIWRNLIHILILIALVVIFYIDTKSSGHNIANPRVFFAFTIAFIVHLIQIKEYRNLKLGLFLLAIPIFGSFGSDVAFSTRATFYIMPIIVFTFAYILILKKKEILALFTIVVAMQLFVFIYFYPTSTGWNGYKIIEQTESANTINPKANILIDKFHYQKCIEYSRFLPKGATVFTNSSGFFGYMYLLDLETPFLYFNYSNDLMELYDKSHPISKDTVFLFEGRYGKLQSMSFLKGLYNECVEIKTDTINNYSIFKLTQRKK